MVESLSLEGQAEVQSKTIRFCAYMIEGLRRDLEEAEFEGLRVAIRKEMRGWMNVLTMAQKTLTELQRALIRGFPKRGRPGTTVTELSSRE